MSIKNEHVVWGFAERNDGTGQVVIVGLTDTGVTFLTTGSAPDKATLVVTPPGTGFANVTQILIFHEKDKATLKRRFYETGLVVSEVH